MQIETTHDVIGIRSILVRRLLPALCVCRALDLALDVVALAEESVPVVEHFLVLVREIVPVRTALFRLER